MCLSSRRFHDNRLRIHKDFRAKWGWEGGVGVGGAPKEDKRNYKDRQVVRNQSNQLKRFFVSKKSQFLLLRIQNKQILPKCTLVK